MNDKDLEKIYKECLQYIEEIKNPILKDCCKQIYFDYKEKIMNKPATTTHHYFKGRLLYHLYCVTRNAIQICNLYPDLKVDMDLIIFGALTHDIGKANQYNDFVDNEDFNICSGNGSQLLGHSYEGAHIVENYLDRYEIDDNFKNQIIHMIESHMKEFCDWGTLVLPKMLEVIIINFADNIDATIEPAHNIIDHAEKGELYTIKNSPRPFYKSLNSYYDIDK